MANIAEIAVSLSWQTLEGIGFGAVAAGYLSYAAWLVKRGRIVLRADIAGPLYFGAVLFTGLWGAMSLVDLSSTKIWTWHAAEQLDQLRYLVWCLFLLALARPASNAPDRSRLTIPAILLASGIAINLMAAFSANQGADMARWIAALHLAWPILTITLIEQVYRNQSDQHRWAAKPLCLGIGGMCVFDIFLYSEAMMFGHADGDVMAARGIVHGAMIALLLIASGRQTGWLRKIHISNVTVFYSASLLLIGLYLVAVSAVGYYVRYFGGTWGGVAQVVVAFGSIVALLLVVLSGSARARLRVFLGKNFLRYHYDYRREWLRFTTMLSSKSSPQDVGSLVTRGLADMVESPGGGLWFKEIGRAHV